MSRITGEDQQKKNDPAQTHAQAVDEGTVLKKDGTPDLRTVENRQEFLKDPSATKSGEPDERLIENRPDLQAHREAHAENLSNVKDEGKQV